MKPELAIYAQLLNIPNLEIEKVEIEKNVFHIYCKIVSTKSQICPSCLKEVEKKTPKYCREIQDLNISGRKVILHLSVHQYLCECGRTSSEKFDFVSEGKSYTKRQAKWVFEMSAKQSHLQVAALVDMCHKTVERICHSQVEVREINWSKIRRIGIDEFAFRKGHKDFIVILVDLDTHDIIDIIEERSKDHLRAYFQGLGDAVCAKVTDFCSDMWGPFQDLAGELFKNATIHIDRFHWTKHLNDVLDNFRKQLRRENKDDEAYKNLKWKLIKRRENLTEKEEKELREVFNLTPDLEEIYEMRNTFQAIFDNSFSYDFAVGQIDIWVEHSRALKNKHLDKFVALFERHRTNILNYFKDRISSGVVEGKNNLLRTIKRFTFNMSNFLNFKRRVFAFDQ
jgi:transposase